MSIESQKRNKKCPSPVSGRPRLRGAISKPAPIDITAMQRQMHAANAAAPSIKTRGAFGGVTKAARKTREEMKDFASKHAVAA